MNNDGNGSTKKDELLRTANTVLLSVIAVVITVASTMIVDSNKRFNDKLDSIMIQVAVNTTNQNGHNIEAGVWKERILENSNDIKAIKNGQVDATMDRITKTQATKAMDDMKIWIEEYFERKKR